jgi:hypothetical protein
MRVKTGQAIDRGMVRPGGTLGGTDNLSEPLRTPPRRGGQAQPLCRFKWYSRLWRAGQNSPDRTHAQKLPTSTPPPLMMPTTGDTVAATKSDSRPSSPGLYGNDVPSCLNFSILLFQTILLQINNYCLRLSAKLRASDIGMTINPSLPPPHPQQFVT